LRVTVTRARKAGTPGTPVEGEAAMKSAWMQWPGWNGPDGMAKIERKQRGTRCLQHRMPPDITAWWQAP
jgi:hypothetical protein